MPLSQAKRATMKGSLGAFVVAGVPFAVAVDPQETFSVSTDPWQVSELSCRTG